MKTSFYFVLWIIIYPVLGLFHNQTINQNAFIFALFIVFGLSYLLARLMPKTLQYERLRYIDQIISEFNSDNIHSIKKRIRADARVETITAIYFIISTFVLLLGVFKFGDRSWISLGIFLLFTIGAVSRSISLIKAVERLKNNPTLEECKKEVAEVYRIDMDQLKSINHASLNSKLISLRTKYFRLFQICSVIIAIICLLLGLYFIFQGASLMFMNRSVEARAISGMYFLYGSLAVYYGIKDTMTIVRNIKSGS